MSDLAAWATLAGALFTAISAAGTWRAATASLRTARQSGETARRAARALGRTRRPDVRAVIGSVNHGDLPDPAPLRVTVIN